MCPTRAWGTSFKIPSTITSPARRMATRASFFPESTLTRAGAMGVSTVVSSSSRSRMAS